MPSGPMTGDPPARPAVVDGLIEAAVRHARAGAVGPAAVRARQALALAPGDPVALFNLGQLAGPGSVAAARWLAQAAARAPSRAEAHGALARTLISRGDRGGSLGAARRAVALAPGGAPHWNNLALLLRTAGALDRADACLGFALGLDPRYEPALLNRSVVRAERGDDAGAGRMRLRGAALLPVPDPFRRALAGRAVTEGRHGDARELLRVALAVAPSDAESWTDLGLVRDELGAPGARAAMRRALALAPSNIWARWNQSVLWLADGDLEAGYRDYDVRWTEPLATDRIGLFRHPLWTGGPVRRRLLLWGEQGLGDEILYAGMLPEAVRRAGAVTLECEPRLVPLFARSFPGVTVVARRDPPAAETAAPDIDAHSTTLRLPRLFRRRAGDFPDHGGYLRPDPGRMLAWRQALAGDGGPVVGFSWTGGSARTGANKVPAAGAWAPFAGIAGLRLVSLIGGAGEDEAIARLPEALARRIRPCPDPAFRDDLDSAAALIAALDGVVGIAGTTAHLAGALGVPGLVLLPRAPIWVWGRSGARCPWYPSLSLFRQSADGDWTDAMHQAARALAHRHGKSDAR